jgi:hypothetical protein
VYLECLAGTLLSLFGSVLWAGRLEPIAAAAEYNRRTWHTAGTWAPAFAALNHRGRAITEALARHGGAGGEGKKSK